MGADQVAQTLTEPHSWKTQVDSRWRGVSGVVSRGLLILVLSYFVVGKAIRPMPTFSVFHNQFSFDMYWSWIASAALICTELALILALILFWRRIAPLTMCVDMLVLFSGFIVWQWVVGSSVGCGCGTNVSGGSVESQRLFALTKNLFLCGLCLVNYSAIRK